MSHSTNISRRLSICTVMQTITHCAPISRASIAKQTGLSKQTISEIVSDLVGKGWIHEKGNTSGHIGRRAVTYELAANAAYIVSVDLGGTKIKVALADLACNIIATLEEPTEPRGGIKVVDQIINLCFKLIELKQIDKKKLRVVVLGVPGVPDTKTGHVLMSPNIKDLNRVNIPKEITAELGCQVIMENDVNLAVFGEHWVGEAEDINNLVYISLGTGIGAGIIIDGQLIRGAFGAAGELGYLPLHNLHSSDPNTNQAGNLEKLVSTNGLCAHYQKISGKSKTVPEIFDAAISGDLAANETLHEAARLLALAVIAVCSIINPTLIIFGGSIGQRSELLELMQDELLESYPYPISIRSSSLSTQAGLIGGIATGLTHLHNILFADGIANVGIVLPKPLQSDLL